MATLTQKQIDLLRKPVFAFVATVMPDNTPQNTPVWIDTDGEAVLFNTAKGRQKTRNLERNPAVAVSFVDPHNPYEMVEIRGRATFVDEGADDHIDAMAKKYLGQDSYPFRTDGEERVIVRIEPESVTGG